MKSPDADVRNQAHGARGHLRRQDRARHASQGARRREGRHRGAARGARPRSSMPATPRPRRCCKRLLADKDLRGAGAPRAGRVRRPEDARRDPRGVRQLHARREARRARHARGPRRRSRRNSWTPSRRRRCRPTDVPAEIVRQLRGYQDAELDKQIADLWGVVRESPAERKAAHRRVEEAADRADRRRRRREPRPGRVRQDVPATATRSTASAARSARTSPARTAATSTTCWRTSSTPARSFRRSTPRRGSSPPTTAPSPASSRAR